MAPLFCIPFAMIPVLFICVVGVIIVFAILNHKQQKKRKESLAQFAQQMGLHFNPDRDRSFDDRYAFFDALRRGDNRYAYNILTGTFEGRSIVGFDYHYETSSTDSDGDRTTHNHHFSAVIIQTTITIDGLTIRPEGAFDRMKRFLGFDDINFESAQFSKQFHVTSRDRQLAYDVIQPRTMEVMLARPRFYLHFERGLVMAMRSRRFESGDYHDALRLTDDILDHVPQSVRETMEMKRG